MVTLLLQQRHFWANADDHPETFVGTLFAFVRLRACQRLRATRGLVLSALLCGDAVVTRAAPIVKAGAG